MQQLLNKLDSQLCETIKTVQEIIMQSPLRDKWDTLGVDADATYQRKIKELYEMVKGWSGVEK